MNNVINEILMEIRKICDIETFNEIDSILVSKLHNYEIIEKKEENELVVYEMTESQKQYQMFFVAKKIEGLSERTLRAYKASIDRFIKFFHKPFNEITTDDMRYYLASYQRKGTAKAITIDNERRYLSTFFNWLETEEYIRRSPLKKIKKIKSKKVVKKAFTSKDIELLRITAEKEEDEYKRRRRLAIVEFLLSTGARATEISNILTTDINMETGEVLITAGKGNKERIVWLNPRALIRYKEYYEKREGTSPYAFCSLIKKNGGYQQVLISGFETEMKELGRAAGVEKTHPHRFRRTCATNLMRRGMAIAEISKYLGHESIATTQIYLEIRDEDIKQSCEKYLI